jgi:uncharacterized protein YbjT (DUF2867 family)
MRTLVVGANGDVGSRTCAALLARGVTVRGSVRDLRRGADLADRGVELVEADLVSDAGLATALPGTDVVVLTANPAAPRRGDSPRAVEDGLVRLVEDAERAGVRRVVLTSFAVSRHDDQVPFARARRRLEERLLAADLEVAILRFPPFMGAWLALAGSSIPLRGSPHGTVGRPSPFLRTFRRATATLVEERGLLLAPGSARLRNAFISEEDVAVEVAAAAVAEQAPAAPVQIGGPEVLTWRQVADTFGALLGRRVRVLATPAPVYAALALVMRVAGEVPSATMALNRYAAGTETVWQPGGGSLLPEQLTTVRDYLVAKLALPADLPTVA